MKRSLAILISVFLLTGCGRLDLLQTIPTQTPETWLRIQPFIKIPIGSTTLFLMQPSTTAIVYLLGVITLGAGIYFLRIRGEQKSRLWWGIALLLWGAGALLAGTSYEAFSYHIKCAGRAACLWTSWWEIVYLIFSVASVDAMLMAEAYACALGKRRKLLIGYALANMLVYLIVVLIGVFLPLRFLISFELLILVCAPAVVIFLVLNGWRYARFKHPMDRALLGIWGWLLLTIAAYFVYYLSGLTQTLWARGLWFSENDVLHIGLIVWMLFIALAAAPKIQDEQTALSAYP